MTGSARRSAAGAAGLVGALIASGLGAPLWAQAAAGAAALLAGAALSRRAAPAAGPPAPPPGPPGGALPFGLGRATLENLPSALLLIDASGRIAFANAAARALLDRLRLGDHYSMSFRNPDFLAGIAGALADGGAREFEFTLHSDRDRVLRAHVQGGIPDIDGRPDAGGPSHVLCIMEDRTRDLRAQRMRTDFIANASHELRTPLASIKGFAETLIGPARDDPEARDRFLAIMLAQAERMQRLVDDLLSLNRIELNEHVPPSGEVDLFALAHEAAAALEPLAGARGVEIRPELPASGAVVRGDRDQLSQAIGNLVENALKYGRRRPVRIVAAPPSPSFPGMVGVTVADEGEGIERRHIPRLTERFYRVSVKRSKEQGGTGLGLAIVKHIVARHRGELSIDSAPGEGSRFTLWFPRAGAAPGSDPAAEAAADPPADPPADPAADPAR